MSFKNEDKIMDFLKENKDKEFKVTEIAEQTKIDIKNMGRYIKQLEEQQKIKVRPVQEGKVRTKFISFTEPTKPKQPSPAPSPMPPSSPPEPAATSQVQGPAIAAIEEKEPEPPKPKIRREPAPEVLEYTASKLKAIAMEELADDPKKWQNYLRQLPNIWGGTRKGGSGWSTGMLAAFDILAVALNKRARKGEAK